MEDVRTRYAPLVLCATGLIVWIVPFIRFGPFAYGYDNGLYRRYVLQPFASFPNAPVPGLDHTVFLPRLVLDAVRFVFHDPDTVLYGTYFVLGIAGLVSVYCFAKHYLGERGALAAGGLYVLSAIQFSAHEAFFFKQAVALPFLLFALLALERRNYLVATLLGILIVLTHQTTSVLYLAIAAVGFLAHTLFSKSISLSYAFSGAVVAAAYLLLHPHVAQKVASPPSAVFLPQTEYLLLSLPIIALAILGLTRFMPTLKKSPVLSGALFLSALFVIFHLPFYSRIYVFFDLFLAVPAAYGVLRVADLARRRTSLERGAILGVVALCVITPMVWLQAHKEASLDPAVQKTLSNLAALPEGSVIITSPALLPWAQGWSNLRVYAPGIFKEPHRLQEWSAYWSHTGPGSDREFLQTFPQPAYVFARPVESRYVPACGNEIRPLLYAIAPCL